MRRKWIGPSVALVIVCVLAYCVGMKVGNASCTAVECTEVLGRATVTSTGPLVVNSVYRYNVFQAVNLRSDINNLGGTRIEHASALVDRFANCSGLIVACTAQHAAGKTFAALVGYSGCDTPVPYLRAFCADASGVGLDDSWHEGKTKDEDPS